MKPIHLSVQIDKVTANNDHTLSLKLETQELSAGVGGEILELMQKQIYIALCEIPLKKEDLEIPESVVEFKKDKSPSERLRSRLYVYFKETHGKDEGFREWYEKTLDTIGQRYLDKLDQ